MPVCLVFGLLITLTSAFTVWYALARDSRRAHLQLSFSVLMGAGSGMTMQLGYAVASLKVPDKDDVFGLIGMQDVAQKRPI